MSNSKIEISKSHHHSKQLVVEYGSLTHIFGKAFHIFDKYVRIFDLYFVATPASPANKLLHGASICYQYIDNTDDGQPDNIDVYMQLVKQRATMIMFKDEDELEREGSRFREELEQEGIEMYLQDLEADEVGEENRFDASLEETFHFLTHGYALAYPEIFGTKQNTYLGNCCDAARGGHFEKPPLKYPPQTWFTYYDSTCDYGCQVTEYIYWAMTSILGAQKDRHGIIKEWQLNTKDLVKKRDPAIYALLTDPFFKLPTTLPHCGIHNLKGTNTITRSKRNRCIWRNSCNCLHSKVKRFFKNHNTEKQL